MAYPIITVGSPIAGEAPQTQISPTRMAGLPPINTVILPTVNGLVVGWCEFGGREHTCISPATHAGIPPIWTVGSPGPVIVPPWVEMSVTLAAAGIIDVSLLYILCSIPFTVVID